MIAIFRKSWGPLFAGVGLFLAFPTVHCYPLAWVALLPLIYGCATVSPVQAAWRFGIAGWIFHSLLLQWLGTNIFWAGGWAIVGYQLLCVGLALFWGMLGFLWVSARRHVPAVSGAVLLALLWTGMEWVQAHLLTGFGWSALGYSQGPDAVLLQCASLGGVSLVSFLLVLVNGLAALACAESRRRYIRLTAVVVVIVASHAIGFLLLGTPGPASRPPLRAGLIQSNFSQEMKWDREYTADMVERAAEFSRSLAKVEKVDCFVWPEALVMQHFETPGLLEPMVALTRDTGAWLFSGAVRTGKEDRKDYNSSVLITPGGEIAGYYDKVHLAPFGEYMPFASIFPFLRQIVPMDVDAGSQQKVLTLGDRRLGPLICFEVLFGPMAENLRRLGADFLVVVTNLAWFGSSNAIPQELEIARFRAVETRLPLVHCANTGISGVFDPWGRFQPVDRVAARSGQIFRWNAIADNPARGIMQRLMGAVPVGPPARRVLPVSPALFSALAGPIGLALLLLGWGAPRVRGKLSGKSGDTHR
jgi:apolipoprotein N-acyltransferase